MKRGFLLSLDALFALGLILLGLSFFALRPSVEPAAGAAFFLAGRDYLASGGSIQADVLRRGWSVSSVPPQSPSGLWVLAQAFSYPHVCGRGTVAGAACLNASDSNLAPVASSVWVGSG